MKHIIIKKTGDASQLQWTDCKLAAPADDEIQLRHRAIGLNFIDVYFRTGLYDAGQLPFTPGLEGAGIVEKIGAQVDGFAVGDRVAYASPPIGAYSEARNMKAARVVKLPDALDDNTAAAIMLKGMTAHYLLRGAYHLQAGDAILVHAAAGGVGLMVCQWAHHLGATVIGAVGGAAKAELARANGCAHVVDYSRDDWVAQVRELTDGNGVAAVYDSVGKDTFMKSLDCIKPRGMMVTFGQSSGAVAPFDIGALNAKGGLFVTRPSLFHYTATREELIFRANELFDAVLSGAVHVHINQTFALEDAAEAHRALEERRTTGATVLLP